MARLTHLAIVLLRTAARADERVEPWLDTAADYSVQTLVWCLVAAEEIEDMKLCRERRYGVERRTTFDEGYGHDV